MNILNVLVWNNATIANNDVECVVSIETSDLATLVARELEKRTGKKFDHWEVRGITSDPIDFNVPIVKMEVE